MFYNLYLYIYIYIYIYVLHKTSDLEGGRTSDLEGATTADLERVRTKVLLRARVLPLGVLQKATLRPAASHSRVSESCCQPLASRVRIILPVLPPAILE